MISLHAKVLLGAVPVLLALAGAAFYLRQNRGAAIGGRISVPKMLWLAYTVGLWFFVCPIVALDPGVGRPLRVTLAAFAAFMWLRGFVELFMMHATRNWRAQYGIGHNLSSIALLAGLIAFYGWPVRTPYDHWVLGLVVLLAITLVIETFYAALFRRAVGGQTTGDDATWFAAAGDARFTRINRITAVINVPLYGLLATFIFRSIFRSVLL